MTPSRTCSRRTLLIAALLLLSLLAAPAAASAGTFCVSDHKARGRCGRKTKHHVKRHARP